MQNFHTKLTAHQLIPQLTTIAHSRYIHILLRSRHDEAASTAGLATLAAASAAFATLATATATVVGILVIDRIDVASRGSVGGRDVLVRPALLGESNRESNHERDHGEGGDGDFDVFLFELHD